MADSAKFAVGSQVWVEDSNIAWIDGEVLAVKGKDIEVQCSSDKKVVVKAVNAYPKDPEFPELGVEDMTRLAYLHEPGVLVNLNCRYDRDEIYTYTGNILIAVNPFKRIERLYAKNMMETYQGRALGEMSPHPYALADSAYRQMIDEKVSQSILVSGESGAGKTESTKMLMQYLAYMGGKKNVEGGQSVEQQVLESNPVLEAFGNAKTVRNNNSSRFGKFVELQFDQRGKITGAAIRTYLLERSRVCQVSDPERNYHCFYMLCAAPSEDIKKYKLENPRTYHYLNQSTFFDLVGLDDSKEYLATRKAMDIVGINSEEQDAIFRVVAAILHLGNCEFTKGESADSSVPKDDKSRLHLTNAAELFMCDVTALENSLCKRVIVTRDESIMKSLDPHTATLSRDALAKIVYSRLFDWIVSRINESIGQDPDSKILIGILDIYGFESFKTNSFEQFCINLTNEKLQQHFNQHVFKMEQEEYTREEIDWSYVEFIDNQDILDLIEKKPGGVIALLDEACMFPRSTHETFAQKLYQTFKDHKRFVKPKLSQTDFTICHYAGDVTYQTDLFLDKNKDYVVAEHQSTLHASKCPFVSSLFPPVPQDGKSSKFSSIGSRCKQQLTTLLETLNATEPHYIRCVKPNNLLKPSIFENFNVLQQLRCGGVLEAIRISCAGFPTRKTFDEFLNRFKILAPNALDGGANEITACKKILEKANLTGHQIGKTKVFLRAGQMAELDASRAEVLGVSAAVIQRRARTYACRKSFTMLKKSAIQIQAFSKGQVARCRFEIMRREAASIHIQKNLRMHLARKAYNSLHSSAISIQTGTRAMAARKELRFRRETKAATLIQRHCRGFLAYIYYLRLKKATLASQCGWRRVMARKELRKLKMAAREAGAILAAKIQLEKDVEELTSSLELEKRLRADADKAKARELAELQSTLQEMQAQFQETKDMLIKEQEASKKGSHAHDGLQSSLEEMQAQFEETKNLLVKEQEASKTMQLQFEETKDLLVKEQEALKKEAHEHAELQSAFQEMQLKFEETKDLLMKEQEVSKKHAELESAFQEMQGQFEETKDLLMKEQDAPKREAQHAPIVHEVPVVDVANMNKLTAENEELKEHAASKQEAEQAPIVNKASKQEAEHAPIVNEASKQEAEQAPIVKEASKKEAVHAPIVKVVPVSDNEIVNKTVAENEELKILVSSLETKISETEKKLEETHKLSEERLKHALDAELKTIELKTEMQRLEEKICDMEAHEQIMRQQALLYSPSTKVSDSVAVQNGHHEAGASAKMGGSDSKKFGSFGLGSRKFGAEQKNFTPEDVDILINCMTQKLGFTEEKPVATVTIYKCLIHWRAFELERTSVFDCLIQMIGSAIENLHDNDHMSYWLSITSVLLFLLQRSLTSVRKPPTPASFFGRVTQSFRSSSASLQVGAADFVRHVEAKYPALLFKQQLTAYVEKIFGLVRENLKNELSPILSSCVQAPEGSTDGSPALENWHKITDSLNRFLSVLKENYVPSALVQKLFTQVFGYINVELVNSLLLHPEWCTVRNGYHVKAGLAELEIWCNQVNEEYAGSSWDELKHIRQAVGFLVIEQKSSITYDDITNDLCPILSVHQLHRICTLHSDVNTDRVSPEVIARMKLLMTDNPDPGDDDTSFLLEDHSSIPFPVEEVTRAFQKMEFTGVKPAAELVENPAFQFLQD